MPISSASSLDEVRAAYEDNGDFAESESRPKALEFAKACRALVARLPAESATGSERVRLDQTIKSVENELKRVNAWLARNPASGQSNGSFVSSFSLRHARGC